MRCKKCLTEMESNFNSKSIITYVCPCCHEEFYTKRVWFISTDGLTLCHSLFEDEIREDIVLFDDNDAFIMTLKYQCELGIKEFNKSWFWDKESAEKKLKELEKGNKNEL